MTENSAKKKSGKRRYRVGYVLRRFPVLSESFILNEILAVEDLDTDVEIFAILQGRDPKFHEGVVKLDANIRYIPSFSDLKSLYRYNRRASKRFGAKYWKVFLRCLVSFSPTYVWRFFQAAYVAERACTRKLDRLHAHFANRATTVAQLAYQLSGIPYSFTAHAVDIYKNKVSRRVLKKKISDASLVITVSEANREYLQDLCKRDSSKLAVVYNGIDMNKFKHFHGYRYFSDIGCF